MRRCIYQGFWSCLLLLCLVLPVRTQQMPRSVERTIRQFRNGSFTLEQQQRKQLKSYLRRRELRHIRNFLLNHVDLNGNGRRDGVEQAFMKRAYQFAEHRFDKTWKRLVSGKETLSLPRDGRKKDSKDQEDAEADKPSSKKELDPLEQTLKRVFLVHQRRTRKERNRNDREEEKLSAFQKQFDRNEDQHLNREERQQLQKVLQQQPMRKLIHEIHTTLLRKPENVGQEERGYFEHPFTERIIRRFRQTYLTPVAEEAKQLILVSDINENRKLDPEEVDGFRSLVPRHFKTAAEDYADTGRSRGGPGMSRENPNLEDESTSPEPTETGGTESSTGGGADSSGSDSGAPPMGQ